MKYSKKQFPKKVLKRIARHKRTRYHNDAALFEDDVPPRLRTRKRNKALRKRQAPVDND